MDEECHWTKIIYACNFQADGLTVPPATSWAAPARSGRWCARYKPTGKARKQAHQYLSSVPRQASCRGEGNQSYDGRAGERQAFSLSSSPRSGSAEPRRDAPFPLPFPSLSRADTTGVHSESNGSTSNKQANRVTPTAWHACACGKLGQAERSDGERTCTGPSVDRAVPCTAAVSYYYKFSPTCADDPGRTRRVLSPEINLGQDRLYVCMYVAWLRRVDADEPGYIHGCMPRAVHCCCHTYLAGWSGYCVCPTPARASLRRHAAYTGRSTKATSSTVQPVLRLRLDLQTRDNDRLFAKKKEKKRQRSLRGAYSIGITMIVAGWGAVCSCLLLVFTRPACSSCPLQNDRCAARSGSVLCSDVPKDSSVALRINSAVRSAAAAACSSSSPILVLF